MLGQWMGVRWSGEDEVTRGPLPSLDRQQLTFHPLLQLAPTSGQHISLDRVFSLPSVFEHTVAVVSNLLQLQCVMASLVRVYLLERVYLKVTVLGVEFLGQRASFVPAKASHNVFFRCCAVSASPSCCEYACFTRALSPAV